MYTKEEAENLKKLVEKYPEDLALKSKYLTACFFSFDYKDEKMCKSAQENVEWLILNRADFEGPWIEWANFFMFDNKKKNELIGLWKKVIAKNIENEKILFNAGVHLTNLDNLFSINCFEQLLKLYPNNIKYFEEYKFRIELFGNPILIRRLNELGS